MSHSGRAKMWFPVLFRKHRFQIFTKAFAGFSNNHFQKVGEVDQVTISKQPSLMKRLFLNASFHPIQNQSCISEKLHKCQLFHVVFKSVCNIIMCLNSLYDFCTQQNKRICVSYMFFVNTKIDKKTNNNSFPALPLFCIPSPIEVSMFRIGIINNPSEKTFPLLIQ